MSVLHLLWIIPLVATIGYAWGALLHDFRSYEEDHSNEIP